MKFDVETADIETLRSAYKALEISGCGMKNIIDKIYDLLKEGKI